jgi:hypothetical protein
MIRLARRNVLLAAVLGSACVGSIDMTNEPGGAEPAGAGPSGTSTTTTARPGAPGTGTGNPAQPGPAAAPGGAIALPGGARPLSPREYDATLRDLLGDTTASGGDVLPEPAAERDLPFDNDAPSKPTTDVLISGLERLAWAAASRAVARPDILAKLLPCAPKGPGDSACFQTFVSSFGRRVLRRPVAADEIAGYLKLQSFATEKSDFNEGVRVAIAAFLQQPDFIYRIEAGAPVAGSPGVFQLDDFEVATKLSYFVLGTTPSDQLLELAAARKLTAPADREAALRMLLADTRARDQVFRFHAQWLGFSRIPLDAGLVGSMNAETRALLDDVVFARNADYHEVLLSERSYIDNTMAALYGIAAPGKPTWVQTMPVGRRGLLSQGSFLSAASKPDDTSPVLRGLLVANRLLCRVIPDPPPEVNVGALPQARCRVDMFKQHEARGSSCAACHSQMDPIGFGLEAYDRTGKFRTTELGKPDCPIDGQGEMPGGSRFRGPAELASLVAASPDFDRCLAHFVHQFAVGRQPAAADDALIDRAATAFRARGSRLIDLLVTLVSDASFALRRADT